MSLNDSLKVSYERQLISKLNIDIDYSSQNNNEIFISLLNNSGSSRTISIYFLNNLIPNITNFNDICVKYFQLLIDEFKAQINQKQNKSNISLISVLNALTNFIKIFSKNQEKYNEKHKNILKQFPQFIQLLFKLFQQKYNSLNQKEIESFLLLILSFIEFYPSLIRNYQNTLEKTIKNIFYSYVINNHSDENNVEIASIIYTNLYKLSPNMNNRYNDYVRNIINNIKYYLEYFKPKSINEEEANKNLTIEEKNNLFFVEKKGDFIDNKNLTHAIKIMEILFNLLEYIFKFIIDNTYFEIDFEQIFSLFNDIMNSYEFMFNNKSLSAIILNGLSKSNYELFLLNINEKVLDLLTFIISHFSRYIYCFNRFFSKLINRVLLNQNYFNNFSFHKKIISFFSIIILHFSDILPDEIDLIIYKHLYNNLPLLYLNYLQINDKTILQVNDVYFKTSNVKNKIYNKNEENRILLISYLELLYNYCTVSRKIWKSSNKNILGGIIDLIILPPFAKFIFNIEEEIKLVIINIIEICVKKNLVLINRIKLHQFLTNFYIFDGIIRYKAESIINLIKITEDELNKELQSELNNDISGQIFNFNKKIKEYLIDANKKLENIKLENTQTNNDNNKIEDINEEKEEEINNENIKIDKEEKEMLNKKRKIKKEYEVKIDNKDIIERKGNKKKNDNINKKKKKEIVNKEDLNLNEKVNESKDKKIIEKENKEEDIQIDEDIDIPDIV